MKPAASTDLARAVVRFFREFLPTQRGVSLHTIRSYRDSLLPLFRHLAEDSGRRVETLMLAEFTADRVIRFLGSLEKERGNSIGTRNVRLAAIHTFARFLVGFHPEHLAEFQAVLGIPFKRGVQRRPVDYLETKEIEALLTGIDLASPAGRRDYALIALMLNTGARVQEVLNLKVRDVRLEPPQQIRFVGKGNKVRLCPIWPRTAKLLEALVATASSESGDVAECHIFLNRRGAPLTRFGVRYLLRKHLPKRLSGASDGSGRTIHPHLLRHTTAVCLLKAGVDFATISQWLGHSSLNVTMRYARADLDLKRQVLAQVFPNALGAPPAGRLRIDGSELTRWLRRL
jgi:integrase/recombinase XerD